MIDTNKRNKKGIMWSEQENETFVFNFYHYFLNKSIQHLSMKIENYNCKAITFHNVYDLYNRLFFSNQVR